MITADAENMRGSRSRGAVIFVGVVLISSLFINAGPAGLAWSDGLLVISLWGSSLILLKRQTTAWFETLFRPLVGIYCLWLIVLVLSTYVAGAPGTALLQSAKTAAGPLYLFSTVILLLHARPETAKRIVVQAATVGLCILAVVAIANRTGLRSGGTFENPIHAATWTAAAMVIVISVKDAPRLLRGLSIVAGAVVLFMSGSFAVYIAIIMVVVYLIASRPGISLAFPLGILALVAVGLYTNLPELVIGLVDPSQRVADSAASRGQIWSIGWQLAQQHLAIGIGPGQFSAREYALMPGYGVGFETHNDYLATLLETGIPGLGLLIAFFTIVWKRGGTVTRSMIILVAVTACFHNVIDFRHYWIMLGIALFLDGVNVREPVVVNMSGDESSNIGKSDARWT